MGGDPGIKCQANGSWTDSQVACVGKERGQERES